MAKAKKVAKKPGRRKITLKPAKAKKKPAAAAAKPVRKAGPRVSWLNPRSNAPMIEEYTKRLGSFMEAIADGHVDDGELKAQEARLVALMKDVEPRLDDALHAKVTQLLCELTAYDMMNLLNAMQAQRPQTTFRG